MIHIPDSFPKKDKIEKKEEEEEKRNNFNTNLLVPIFWSSYAFPLKTSRNYHLVYFALQKLLNLLLIIKISNKI